MSDKMEQIPEELFHLLQSRNFEELSANERTELLRYLSEEEYKELRNAMLLLSSNKSKNTTIRSGLMSAYEAKHRSFRILSGALLWKAAALFFLFSSAVFFAYMMRYRHMTEISAANTATIRDTVFVLQQKMNEIEKIIDTVYLPGPLNNEAYRKVRFRDKSSALRIGKVGLQQEELNIMGLEELEGNPSRQKKNSVKDDTLMKKYSFTTTL